MKILNLGCGTKVHPEVVNIDNDLALRIISSWIFRLFFRKHSMKSKEIKRNVNFVNLKNGIPFETNSFDLVFHSHLLEHISFDLRESFIKENLRVLRPGGVVRIVVPDFEVVLRKLISQIDSEDSHIGDNTHELLLFGAIEQSIRVVPGRYQGWSPMARRAASLVFGNARKRGEIHQMLYTRTAVRNLLTRCGFHKIEFFEFNKSTFANWKNFRLEMNDLDEELHPNSLYAEATKPS